MPKVVFTNNLSRHIECPTDQVVAENVRDSLEQVFENNKKLKNYVLDDQLRLRQHMLIIVDGVPVEDRLTLTDSVLPESEIYIMQALSGG